MLGKGKKRKFSFFSIFFSLLFNFDTVDKKLYADPSLWSVKT